ncbi:MAG: helix-turn-helix domain-containing protein [Candidatus Competibacteraceae bacterium]
MKEVMTAVDAAEVLAVTPKTIRRWLQLGTLSGANTPAGWRVTSEDIQQFLKQHRRKA